MLNLEKVGIVLREVGKALGKAVLYQLLLAFSVSFGDFQIPKDPLKLMGSETCKPRQFLP